jgi:hypothetical protein
VTAKDCGVALGTVQRIAAMLRPFGEPNVEPGGGVKRRRCHDGQRRQQRDPACAPLGVPLTKNYLDLTYLGEPPDELGAEGRGRVAAKAGGGGGA